MTNKILKIEAQQAYINGLLDGEMFDYSNIEDTIERAYITSMYVRGLIDKLK